jgi:hypothetical protein
MVREILRARIAASGIGRLGERPAFDPVAWAVECQGRGRPPTFEPAMDNARHIDAGPPRRLWEAPTVTTVALEDLVGGPAEDLAELGDPMEAAALEDEQLCSCGHVDGVHMRGTNACARAWCPCVEFEAAPAVEAVQ